MGPKIRYKQHLSTRGVDTECVSRAVLTFHLSSLLRVTREVVTRTNRSKTDSGRHRGMTVEAKVYTARSVSW